MARSFAFLPDPTPIAHDSSGLWHLQRVRGQRAPRDLIRDQVASLCAPYAGAHAQLQDQVILVRGSGPFGIDIAVCLLEDTCTLWLGGWYDEMPDTSLALRYVARAIDGRLRLRVHCADHRPRTWIVECRTDDGAWIEEASTRAVGIWPRRMETVVYLSNVYGPSPAAIRPPLRLGHRTRATAPRQRI